MFLMFEKIYILISHHIALHIWYFIEYVVHFSLNNMILELGGL